MRLSLLEMSLAKFQTSAKTSRAAQYLAVLIIVSSAFFYLNAFKESHQIAPHEQQQCHCPSTSSCSETLVEYDPMTNNFTCTTSTESIPCPFRTQFNEDRDFMRYLAKKMNLNGKFPQTGPENVILEIGALDGLSGSTTYFFEKYLNWRAVHFEGSRVNFENLAKNRPTSLNVHVAGCAKEQRSTYVDSGAVSGVVSSMSESFKAAFHPNYDKELKYEVDCVPLSKYLKIFGINRIEVFVLDTEGHELDVLLGVDLDITKVHYFIIEEDHSNKPKEEKVRKILASHDFRFLGPFGETRNGFYENTNWK